MRGHDDDRASFHCGNRQADLGEALKMAAAAAGLMADFVSFLLSAYEFTVLVRNARTRARVKAQQFPPYFFFCSVSLFTNDEPNYYTIHTKNHYNYY